MGLFGSRMVDAFRSFLMAAFDSASGGSTREAGMQNLILGLRAPLIQSCIPVAIIMTTIVGASLLCSILQGGGVQVSGAALGFRFDRINPATNAKNVFSLRAASRVGKSIIPAMILAIVAVQRIAHQLSIPPFSTKRLELLGADVYGLLAATAWVLLGWALIDYIVEWRSREARLMMSREELKQEFKEMEGSPQTKSRIRGLQRQMRRRKVKSDVGRAAVVLTNPTHYAVALGFDFGTMEAPRVVAKGRNLRAEEIKSEARWAGVPIVENPPLARSLYRWVEVGQAIPADLYEAVAAILAYLYRQRVEEELRERRARNRERNGTAPHTSLNVAQQRSEGKEKGKK